MSIVHAVTTTTTTTTFGGSNGSNITRMLTGEGKKGAAAAGRSMVISPNLDALLEHEERQRRPSQGAQSIITTDGPRSPIDQPISPQSASVSPSSEFPVGLPPPPRRSRGPKSPRSPSGGTTSTMGYGEQERPSTGSSSRSNPYINPAPTLEDMLEQSRDSRTQPASQQSTCSDNVLDVQEQSTDDSQSAATRTPNNRGDAPWRRQPLISHGQRSSVSSAESVSSTNPASSTENQVRISISSTIYQPSAESHTHTLFNEPPLDPYAHRNSFMEIYSPTNAQFNLEPISTASTGNISPILFTQSPASEIYPPRVPSPKPPVPTAPKPIFSRTNLRTKPQASPKGSPPDANTDQLKPKPATTNFLDVDERADLVRKSRKLARLFGQTPDADAMAQQDSGRSVNNAFLSSRRKVSGLDSLQRPHSSWRHPSSDTLNLGPVRRHSMPLSPDDVSFISIVSPTFDDQTSRRPHEESTPSGQPTIDAPNRSGSPTSFIDLSEDGVEPPDSASIRVAPRPISPSQSLFETMSVDQQEAERRQKRERLAKLHRFLGSRVPAELVLGVDNVEASLPPPQRTPTPPKGSSSESDNDIRKTWLKRRRTASVALAPSSWSDDLERVKADLDDREKAINVRRAQKMEKVFGVAPPQTLYHTRHYPSSSIPPAKSISPRALGKTASFIPPIDALSPLPTHISPERSSFTKAPKPKKKKDARPGTSESNKQLLPKGSFGFSGFDERLAANTAPANMPDTAATSDNRHSFIYNHYQHSLNSLNDILDRDDRASLAELHEYLNSGEMTGQQKPQSQVEDETGIATPTPTAIRTDRRLSIASSIKSERRRSLPARTSMVSLTSSEYSLGTTPTAADLTFQMRRRRAAKLTQFFGVDYRDLINDVLESIESGVQLEERNGTLRAEEVEDLLAKLRNLRVKRQSFI